MDAEQPKRIKLLHKSFFLIWVVLNSLVPLPLEAQQGVSLQEIDLLPEEEQLAVYQQLVEKYPRDARFHNSLGFCYYRVGNYEVAEKWYTKALTLDPTYSTAYNNLGVLYLRRGQYAFAIQHFEKALEHKPDNVKAMYNLGVAHFKEGNYFTALRCYRNAKNIDAHYVKERGTSEKAKKEMGEALERDPDNRILQRANSHLNH